MSTSPFDAALADVAVIGAGPAGLAAAVTAAERGASVVLIDAESDVGGQFWRHPAGSVDDCQRTERLHHDLRRYRRLRHRVQSLSADGSVTYLPRGSVWAIDREADSATGTRFFLHIVADDLPPREKTVAARALIIATGAYDLQLPFPGWDLPGVMTAGGAQSLLKGHGVLAGSRVVVAGTGPFLMSVASGLVAFGARVPVIAEANRPSRWIRQLGALPGAMDKLVEGAGYAVDLARHHVMYKTGWTVLSANGTDVLKSVTLAPLGRDGSANEAASRTVPCDALAVGWGFVPRLEIALMVGCSSAPGANGLPVAVADRWQRADVPGVYLAGEVCGIGGSGVAVVEGEIAGHTASNDLLPSDGRATGVPRGLTARHWRLQRFASALSEAYPVPRRWQERVSGDTMVCRCEEVSAGVIREGARRSGAGDARSLKLLARPGMGWCQGRICGYATECLAAEAVGKSPRHVASQRPVAAPLPLGLVTSGQ